WIQARFTELVRVQPGRDGRSRNGPAKRRFRHIRKGQEGEATRHLSHSSPVIVQPSRSFLICLLTGPGSAFRNGASSAERYQGGGGPSPGRRVNESSINFVGRPGRGIFLSGFG